MAPISSYRETHITDEVSFKKVFARSPQKFVRFPAFKRVKLMFSPGKEDSALAMRWTFTEAERFRDREIKASEWTALSG